MRRTWILSIVLLLCLGLWAWDGLRVRQAPQPRRDGAAPSQTPDAARLAGRPAPEPASAPPESPPFSIQGYICTPGGRPAVAATVRWRSYKGEEARTVQTGADGRFALEIPEEEGYIDVASEAGCIQDSLRAKDFRDLRLRLEETAPLEGVLRTAEGVGVEGARVSTAGWGLLSCATVTDASGAFRLARVPRSRPFMLRVNAGAQGWLERPDLVWAEGVSLSLTLRTPRTASGRVVTMKAGGVTVGVGSVRVLSTLLVDGECRGWDGTGTVTDADGYFQLEGLTSQGELFVSDPDWEARYAWIGVPIGEDVVVEVVPTQSKRATVRGTVINGQGEPVPGATVVSAGHVEGVMATADAQGRFTLSRVQCDPSERQIRAWHEDLQGTTDVTVEPGAVVADVSLVVERTPSIFGRVVDPEGTPVANARIRATHYARSGRGMDGSVDVTTTDTEGRFHCVGLLEASPYHLSVRASGYVHWRRGEVPSRIGGHDAGTIELERTVLCEGRVVDRAGEPIPTANYRVVGGACDRMQPVAADGTFHFETSPEGRHEQVLGAAEGYQSAALEAGIAPDRRPVEIVLEPAHLVRGRLVDATGDPMVSACLKIRGTGQVDPHLTRTTDLSGRFHFWVDAPGAYAVELFSPMLFDILLPRGASLPADGEEGTIQESVPGTFTGRVVDAHGKPVAGIRLGARCGDRCVPEYAVTDRDGAFRIEGRTGETYRVTVFGSVEGSAFRPAIGARVGETHVRLAGESTVTISGTVLWPDGSPASEATVEASPVGHIAETISTRTGEDGTFRFDQALPGLYQLEASDWVVIDDAGVRYEAIHCPIQAGTSGTLLTLQEKPAED